MGAPHFRLDGKPLTGFATRKSLALLVYLACQDRAVQRDQVAGIFWPDKSETEAKNNLRRVLPNLRKMFGDYLRIARQTLGVERRASCWMDVEEFTAAMRLAQNNPLTDSDVDAFEAALGLYTGEFLAGFNLSEAPAFEEWVTVQREHLRELALRGLSLLTEYFIQTRQLRRGLASSQRLLALEPWHERGYQQRMILLAWHGERAAALQQYELCKRMLADEFGLLPGQETTELYVRIKAGEFDPVTPAVALDTPSQPLMPGLEDVPRQTHFVGRDAELARLATWHQVERRAIIAILGVGGAGKTALAAHYVQATAASTGASPAFEYVLWASLLNAPSLASLLRVWLRTLSAERAAPPSEDSEELLAQLFPYLRARRCLLVLDNVESILQEGSARGHFRAGSTEYGRLLQRLAEAPHASTLLLTARELPAVLTRSTRTPDSAIRTLMLAGLPENSSAELLAHTGLVDAPDDIAALVRHYSGNPLALKLVADTVRDLFGGDLHAFLVHGMPVFGDIRTVLEEQTARLTGLEREILGWLAIAREPVAVNKVLDALVGPLDRFELLHAMNTLLHTSLVEREQGLEESGPVRLTLQNVVMEYMTDRLLAGFTDDLARGAGETLRRYALVTAGAPEYVQASQRRLLLQPVADWMGARWGREGAIARLHAVLPALRCEGLGTTGYAAANLLHLLLVSQADVRGLNLSRLAVRQADLRTAALVGVDFTGADLTGTIFASTLGAIESIAISQDERHFAAAGSDGAIYLWRIGDFELVNTLHRHTIVSTVAFSTDGRLLLSSGLDGLIYLWDIATGALLSSIAQPERPIICAALHPNGALVAGASTDETIRIWEWRSGVLHALLRAPAVLSSLVYSPDGQTLVSVGDEQTICLWDTHDGALRQQRRGHRGKVEAVAFHPNGEIFATGGEDGCIYVWGMQDAAPLRILDGHRDFVLALAFTPDGAWLASCSADQTACIWKLDTGARHRVLTGHRGWVSAVTFAAHGRMVLTAGYDQSVRVWDAHSGQMEHLLKGHLRWVDYVTFSNDGRRLASCSLDGPVRLWNVETGELLHTLYGPEAATRILAFSHNGELLAAAGDDQKVRVWDARTGALLHTLHGHRGSVRNVIFSADDRWLVSAGHDGTLRCWDVARGQIARVVANVSAINRLAIAVDAGHGLLAYGTQDNRIVLEEIVSGQVMRVLDTGAMMPTVVALDPSHRWLACGSGDGALLIYALAEDAVPAPCIQIEATGAPVWRLLFSPDSTVLAWITTEQEIQLLSLASGQVYTKLLTYFGAFCLDFSADGRSIITDGSDYTVLVRDAHTGALQQTLRDHSAAVTCIEISPRGECIASSSADGTIRLWNMNTGERVATLDAQGPYAGMRIAGVTGITPAQRESLLLLGAQQ